jgi:hypothetical protein
MQNILDYLEWRGDIRFDQDGFNEVDNLVLSSLSYLEFANIVPSPTIQSAVVLDEVARLNTDQIDKFASLTHNPVFKLLPELFYKTAQSLRYRDVELSNYVNEVSHEQSKQFSAVVFSINPNLHFIAFRGTDDTITGWKEDLQMAFMDEVPAQRQAAVYLNSVCPGLEGQLYIGGHSKGGNLAIYAAAQADSKISSRIISVFNNDGPGFQPRVIQSAGYQRIVDKICSLVPNSSVVGKLLEHTSKYKIISSSETGIMQHDSFSWEVKGTHFVYDKAATRTSSILNNTIKAWLADLSTEEREQVVNVLFEVIQSTGATTIGDLSKARLTKSVTMINSFNHLDIRTRLHLIKMVTLFFRESRKNINKTIAKEIDSRREKRKLETRRGKLATSPSRSQFLLDP